MGTTATRRGRRILAIAALVVVATACGGSDDDADGGSADDDSAADEGGASDDAGDDSGDGSGGDDGSAGDPSDLDSLVVLGTPPVTADPGTAFVELDGERLDYAASGSINVQCTVTDAQVSVNFQTADGHDLLVQGAPQDGSWFLTTTFARGGDNTRYTAESIARDGTFTIGDGALSYEGQVARVVDFDVANAEMVDARMAVNCDPAGGGSDPTAEIGDAAYAFPVSGAQSVTCTVTDDAVEVRINRLALEGTQLEINATSDGGQWLGNVTVYTADGNLSSTIPADGTGLTIDGTTVTYDGTFTTPSGDQTGTATATC